MAITTFFSDASVTDLAIGDRIKSLTNRATRAVHEAMARDKARRDYRQTLDCEDRIFTDVGLTRADIRKAYRDFGGRG